MQRWNVSCQDGTTEVEGGSWLAAVAGAVNKLGLAPAVLARMVCEVDSGRSVIIRNAASGYVFLIERLGVNPEREMSLEGAVTLPPDDAAGLDSVIEHDSIFEMPSPVMGTSISRSPVGVWAGGPESFDDLSLPPMSEDTLPPATNPLPALHMRVPDLLPSAAEPASIDRLASLTTDGGFSFEAPPSDLAETLFMSAFDISGASSMEDAASEALKAVLGLVQAEAAAVLYAGKGDVSLRFLAATGPQAAEARLHTIPLDEGVAGFVHRSGSSVIIQDAVHDERIHREVERATGYLNQSMLAVVVQDRAGTIHGCLELLNPPKRFQAWHLDAALAVATSLGDWIGAQATP